MRNQPDAFFDFCECTWASVPRMPTWARVVLHVTPFLEWPFLVYLLLRKPLRPRIPRHELAFRVFVFLRGRLCKVRSPPRWEIPLE